MKKVLTGLDSREYEHPAGREVMINKKLIIINLTILFNLVHLFANPYTCYKSVGTAKDGRVSNDNTNVTYIYIAFSDDKSYCYEVDENGKLFANNPLKPDFINCPHLLGYRNYYLKEITNEGYRIYEAPKYYSDELIETVIFSNDFSRINKPYYMMVHDWNYGFDYPQLMTTFIYEKCKSPKKEKKSTPFY